MARRIALSLICASVLTGCVKEISSEERLERESPQVPVGQPIGAEELARVTCEDASQELQKARNESRPEAERVLAYVALYESLKKRSRTFEEAMARNPDLTYQEGSRALVAARELCIQQTADVRVEFDRYVRELVDVPTVQEIKGGNTITVARVDFDTLRRAIEALAADDRDALLNRVSSAEKKVETARPEPRKRGK